MSKGVGTITQPNIKIVVAMSNALESNPHKCLQYKWGMLLIKNINLVCSWNIKRAWYVNEDGNLMYSIEIMLILIKTK